jgi:hypothetical protein
MVVDLDALLKENAQQRALIHRLTEQLAKLNDRVAELLAAAQRRQRKPTPEKLPAPAPVLRGDVKERFDARPEAPPKPERSPKPKSIAKRTGRKPVPSHLEVEEHRVRPAACGNCGSGALDVADEIVAYEAVDLHLVPLIQDAIQRDDRPLLSASLHLSSAWQQAKIRKLSTSSGSGCAQHLGGTSEALLALSRAHMGPLTRDIPIRWN